jgi:hypothetical protein
MCILNNFTSYFRKLKLSNSIMSDSSEDDIFFNPPNPKEKPSVCTTKGKDVLYWILGTLVF